MWGSVRVDQEAERAEESMDRSLYCDVYRKKWERQGKQGLGLGSLKIFSGLCTGAGFLVTWSWDD